MNVWGQSHFIKLIKTLKSDFSNLFNYIDPLALLFLPLKVILDIRVLVWCIGSLQNSPLICRLIIDAIVSKCCLLLADKFFHDGQYFLNDDWD